MRQHRIVAAVAIAACSLSLPAFAQVDKQAAARAHDEGTKLYRQQQYQEAAQRFEEAIRLDPQLTDVYFYVGNCYDNQFKATLRGDPANDAYLTKAIENYTAATERATDPKIRKLSFQFLVNAYAPDKANDPVAAEPILIKMIEAEPADPGNYSLLAKLYEDYGLYEESEDVLLRAREAAPQNAVVYGLLAGFYNRRGEFDQTIDAYRQWQHVEPGNPEVHYTIASCYWDKAYHNARLRETEKKDLVAKGMEQIDKALQLKPDYIDAMVRKSLLLRLQAAMESDPAWAQMWLREATELVDKAVELQKKRAAEGAKRK